MPVGICYLACAILEIGYKKRNDWTHALNGEETAVAINCS